MQKILTISASPYLLTKLGRINSDFLCYFNSKDYLVASLAWDLDSMWYPPNEEGRILFEKDGKQICDIYSLPNSPSSAAVQAFEVIKALKPDIVISIGEIRETEIILAVKNILGKDSFRWVNIITSSSFPIGNKLEILEAIDDCIVTNKKGKDNLDNLHINSKYIPYGPNHDHFYSNREVNDSFSVINLSKNSTASNTASVIRAISDANKNDENVKGYLHSNINDVGDYDIASLIDRYDKKNIIKLPDTFVGLNDGISDSDLNKMMNKSDMVVDISVRSATGLGLLEAMATGCIPLVSPVGALKEIVDLMPESSRFFIKGVDYVSYGGEECFIADYKDLSERINDLCKVKASCPGYFYSLAESAKMIAKKFSNKAFLDNIKGIIESPRNEKDVLLESF